MAITSSLTNSYITETLQGRHQLRDTAGNALKLALIKASHTGTYGSGSTNYSDITGNTDETTNDGGAAYVAGGETLAVASTYPKLETGSTFVVDFDNVVWNSASFSADGAMAYNTDATLGTANRAIAVWAFSGAPITAVNGTFTVAFPTPGASTGAVYIDRA